VTITIPGFDPSTKLPGTYIATVFGGAPTSPSDVAIKTLLVGNMIGSPITGSAPTLSVAAGTASLNTAYQLFSADDAKVYFGAGSELHRMALVFFGIYPGGTCWAIATAQGSTASTGIITATGTPTAALTARVWINEEFVDVAIAASDTVTTIATAIATAINQQTAWPVTAQFALGVVTITAKHTGLRGKQIQFRVSLINSTQTVDAVAGALSATLSGSTLTLSGGTAVGTSSVGAYVFTGGSTEETTTSALAAIAATRYHRINLAQQTSTEIARVATQVDAMAGVGTQLRQQIVAGSVDTYANVVTLADGLQRVRVSIGWSYDNPMGTGELATAYNAGRLNGDAALGGALNGEVQDPNANLDQIRLAGTKVPRARSDWPTRTQMNAALGAGVTPLEPLDTGLLRITRAITTRSEDDAGNPNYSVLDTSIVTTLDYEADALTGLLEAWRAGKKLAPDQADGTVIKRAGVVTPRGGRGMVHGFLKAEETDGRIIDVDDAAMLEQFAVIIDPANRSRVLANVPIRPTPGCHQIAAAIRQAA